MGKILLEFNETIIYNQLEKEFGKTKKDIDEDVRIIQEWLETQPHLPDIPNVEIIRSFLIFNKFSIEKSKQKLDMYYTIRNVVPEIACRNPCSPEMIEQSKISYCIPLPRLASDYKRVIYSKLSDAYGTEKFDAEKYVSHIFNVLELLIREDLFLGAHFIIDAGSFKLGHLTKLSPMLFKKAALIMEKVFSSRVSSIHCINYNTGLETTINLAKSLLPKKIGERFHTHKNQEVLFTIFPKSILPKDVGGDEDSIADLNELWIKKFLEYKTEFDKIEKLKVNESLRPEKLVNDEVLGYYGNFKKLDFD